MVLPQGLLVCQTLQVVLAGNTYAVSLLPRGQCALCCEIIPEEDILFIKHSPTEEFLRAGVRVGAPGLDASKPTVIYIPGFTEDVSSSSASTVRHSYFGSGRDVNFLTMDWARLATFPWYTNAVENCPVAGDYLARFLERLFQDGVDPATTHLVGFSLGAEVAGMAAKSLRGWRLGRITGLDPAFPLLSLARRAGRPVGKLCRDDADFVDVIHTNSGVFGVREPMGHADFYPNGNCPVQPGCKLSQLLRTESGSPVDFIACSHSRAWKYYSESLLQPEGFVAMRCRSEADFRSGRCEQQVLRSAEPANDTDVVYMGADAASRCRGSYFLDTNDQFPFARGLDFRRR